MMKSLTGLLSAVALAGSIGVATAADKEVEIRHFDNFSCTNDGNGAFSIHVDGYDKPMVSITKSFYALDANHAVLAHIPDGYPNVYKGKFIDLPNVKVSAEFKKALENFNGRFLMQYDLGECQMEERFSDQNAVRTTIMKIVSKGPK